MEIYVKILSIFLHYYFFFLALPVRKGREFAIRSCLISINQYAQTHIDVFIIIIPLCVLYFQFLFFLSMTSWMGLVACIIMLMLYIFTIHKFFFSIFVRKYPNTNAIHLTHPSSTVVSVCISLTSMYVPLSKHSTIIIFEIEKSDIYYM